MIIKPLSKENLEEAINLADKIFPDEVGGTYEDRRVFTESLDKEKYQESWDKHVVKSMKYFLAVDEKTDKIIGTTGLYTRAIDPEEWVWLGWYGIDSEYRGKGLGKELLNWTIDKAKEEGYKIMRLYTSTNENEAMAQKLYDALEFKIVKEGDDPEGGPDKILYREKKL